MQRLTIIGCGRLGHTLAYLWHRQNVLEIGEILTTSAASAADAARFIGAGVAVSEFSELQASDFYLIATPDDCIPTLAQTLARRAKLKSGAIAFHASGALESSVLNPLHAQGLSIASVHPIKTFASPESSIESFCGTPCALEGQASAVVELQRIFAAIGGNCFSISSEAKLLYHAGIVIACNYLVTLLDSSQQALCAAGISTAQVPELLGPIVRETVENALSLGSSRSLTGPIARGDFQLVAAQLRALAGLDPELAELYRKLGLRTLQIAEQKNSTSSDNLQQIRTLLSSQVA